MLLKKNLLRSTKHTLFILLQSASDWKYQKLVQAKCDPFSALRSYDHNSPLTMKRIQVIKVTVLLFFFFLLLLLLIMQLSEPNP